MVDMEVHTLTKAIFAKVERSLLQEETAKHQAEAATGGLQFQSCFYNALSLPSFLSELCGVDLVYWSAHVIRHH